MKKLTTLLMACFLCYFTMGACNTTQSSQNNIEKSATTVLLDKFEQQLNNQKNANLFSVGVYQDGEIQTRLFGKNNACQNAYSLAKTFIVTAIGLLVDKNLLSVNERLVDILADQLPKTYNEVWKNTTVEMLLLHNVGLEEGCLDIDVNNATDFGEDYLSYVLNAPINKNFSPETYSYTDASYYLLSRIIEVKSGMRTDDFLWKYLFYPIGCREVAWSSCPQGHVIGAPGLYIRIEDLVKHGSIYLNGGTYENKRILSQSWVDTVFAKGYEFKTYDNGVTFEKGGMNGQRVVIVPHLNRVVAWLGYGENDFKNLTLQ